MTRAFLYIDILSFRTLVKDSSSKLDQIFKIFDSLKVFRHHALQTVVFSDTMLVFSKEENYPTHYYFTFLTEYAQQLFYRLSSINIYFKAILTIGDFHFHELQNHQAYYGQALVDAYDSEKELPGFGLFVDIRYSGNIIAFVEVPFTEKFNFVILCQSLSNLYRHVKGALPVLSIDLFLETDTYFMIEEDLRFLREVNYYRSRITNARIQEKYKVVYDIYKSTFPLFFKIFERSEFSPVVIHPDFPCRINFEEILAIEDVARINGTL